jgi:hypothetical protein
MKIKMIAPAVAMLAAMFLAAPAQQEKVTIADFAWLAGCWEMSVPERGMTITEHWMAPAAGTMIGMGRTIRDGKTTGHEFLRIEEREGGLVYIAKPSQNKEETVFKLASSSKGEVIFENPTHDFPQRIIYKQSSADELHARVEGERDGQTRGFDIPKKRVKCS